VQSEPQNTMTTENLIRSVVIGNKSHSAPSQQGESDNQQVKQTTYAQAAKKAVASSPEDVSSPPQAAQVHPRMKQPQHKHVPSKGRNDEESCVVS
jgi:hypothetical protein